jgi:hypothetical protein
MATPTMSSGPEPRRGPPGTAASARGWAGRGPGWGSRVTGGRARVPYLLVGVLLVVGCTAAVLATVVTVGGRSTGLVLARPVVAGQLLGPGDVRSVSLSADPGLDLVPADAPVEVVGRRAAYSLPAGAVLTRGVLGAAKVPPPGLGVVAVAAAPGQFPPDLTAGTPVSIIQVTDSSSGLPAGARGSWPGVVTQVARTATDQTTVITVQLPAAGARQVAAIPAGQLSVVAETGDR